MLLSIIIPVYKVEKYIERCLQSVVDGYNLQDNNIEVLVVDDGSPDSSGVIADDFANKYSCFKVIHKKNAGVAAARNTGIVNATGKWVYFVDSDDWLAKDAVDMVCRRIKTHEEADVLIFDAYQNVLNEEKKWEHFEREQIWNCKEQIQMLQRGMLYFPIVNKKTKTPLAAPWDKVYKRSFLEKNGLFFQEKLKVLDDMVFNFEVFGAAQKVVYCKDRIYHYRFVPDSITNQYKNNRVELDRAVWKYLREYIECNCQQEREAFLQAYYCRLVKSFSICTRLQFFNDANLSSLSDKINVVKTVLKSEPYFEAFHNVTLRNAEWMLKLMICMGRLQWGYGVYLLYLGHKATRKYL